ncbi:MAG: hypothetical protein WAU70_12240 [Flavobacteriales bacterium]
MTRPELVAYLNALETEHDVNAMFLDDACVWPLIRQKIGEFLLRNEEPPGSEDFELPASKTRRAFRFGNGLARMGWSRIAFARIDLLFLSLAAHKQLVQHVRYDRFSDPLLGAAVRNGFKCLVLEHGEASLIDHGQRVHHWDLAPQLEAGAALHWRKAQPAIASVPVLPDLLQRVELDGHVMDRSFLRNQLHTFRFYRQVYHGLLKRLRPRCVFMVCWYSAENMALVHECRQLGIRSVDLQHGVQGPAHLAYGSWKVIPGTGYSVMPSVFWCWDRQSVTNIERWASGTPHRALYLGDPFMEYSANLPRDARWKNDGRKRVLYAIQPLNDVVPALILRTIHATRSMAQWMIRTHPNWKRTIPAIVAILEKEGLQHEVVIDDGSITPLAPVLASADLHVTDFSSVVIEAASLGIPSAAVHPHAADVFTEHLSNGSLSMTLTSEALIAWVHAPGVPPALPDPLPPLVDRMALAMGIPEPLPTGL